MCGYLLTELTLIVFLDMPLSTTLFTWTNYFGELYRQIYFEYVREFAAIDGPILQDQSILEKLWENKAFFLHICILQSIHPLLNFCEFMISQMKDEP